MCHAYVVWELKEKGAGAREPLRFVPDFRWTVGERRAGARRLPRIRLPRPVAEALAGPGWRRPAFGAAVVVAVALPFLG